MRSFELNLYNEDDEVVKTLETKALPFSLLGKAIGMQNLSDTNPDDLSEEDVDKIETLISAIFCGQATKEEIEEGSSLDEMLPVLTSFLAIVGSIKGYKADTSKPIKLVLIDEKGEQTKMFTRSFVPLKILKVAVRVHKKLHEGITSEDDMYGIAELIAAIFGHKVTSEEIVQSASLDSVIESIAQIFARTRGEVSAYPTPPGS